MATVLNPFRTIGSEAQADAQSNRTQAAHPAGESGERALVLSGRVLLTDLALAAALLLGVSFAQDVVAYGFPELGLGRVWRLDVDAEVSIPTWFASSLILLNALLLGAVAWQKFTARERLRWHWAALAVIFLALSADETAALHNALSSAISRVVDTGGVFHFAWVLPALVLCVLGLLAYVPFILDFKAYERVLLLGSAALFLAGAVGVEMAGGAYVEQYGMDRFGYRLLATAEEALEFCGMLVFLAAILLYARNRIGTFRLTLS